MTLQSLFMARWDDYDCWNTCKLGFGVRLTQNFKGIILSRTIRVLPYCICLWLYDCNVIFLENFVISVISSLNLCVLRVGTLLYTTESYIMSHTIIVECQLGTEGNSFSYTVYIVVLSHWQWREPGRAGVTSPPPRRPLDTHCPWCSGISWLRLWQSMESFSLPRRRCSLGRTEDNWSSRQEKTLLMSVRRY